MRTVRITFKSGQQLETAINGSDDDIKNYYLGNEFNLGDAVSDLMTTAVCVEVLRG